MDTKLCVTCKHHRPGVYANEAKYSRCIQPELVAIYGDKIFGTPPGALRMRESLDDGACGPMGKKHELEEAGHG